MSDTKPCIACGKQLPLGEFYAHPQMADGHLNKCKLCCRIYEQQRRLTTPNYQQEYERERWRNNPARREQAADHLRRWRAENPAKNRAHDAVGKALRSGKLQREPCAHCGDANVEAHHEDYGQPLNVIWVCHACHLRHYHLELIEGEIT